MKAFTADVLNTLGPLGWVVHIGAGSGSTLSEPWTTKAEHIVLVEADPKVAEVAKQAAQLHANADNIHVLERAVGATDTKAEWTTYNLVEFSSTAAPTGLLTLFPGLRETAAYPVQVDTTATLLARFEISQITDNTANVSIGNTQANPNVLILNAPGEMATILTSLIYNGQLDIFDHIFVQLPILCLYEGSVPRTDMLALLARAHFDLVTQHASDPDLPICHIQKNIAAKKDAITQTKLATLSAEIDQLKQDGERLRGQHDGLRAQEAKIPELETEIDQLKKGSAHLREQYDKAHTTHEKNNVLADKAHTELQTLYDQQRKQTELRIADLKDLQDKYENTQSIRRDQDIMLGQLATYVDQALAVISPAKAPSSTSRKTSTKKTVSKKASTVKTGLKS
jgi:FkbM family methyltransferase